MTLEAGSRLANYEILEPIGAGGMGEVFRGRDTKLGRDVAIKVLPDDFADVPERLERFEREAKLLASLNHTNVATPLRARALRGPAVSRHGARRGRDARRAHRAGTHPL